MLADSLEHVLDGDLAAAIVSGQDRAAIDEDRRHVEADHRHHHAGQRLVAAGKPDQRVVAMAAHRQFDRIGDHVARNQRRLHALVAHGDAVGNGDGAEFARRAVGGSDALLDHLRLAHQRNVAGSGLVPAACDADQRLRDLGGRQSHRIEIRAVRRTRRPFGHIAARKFGFRNYSGVHAFPCRVRCGMFLLGRVLSGGAGSRRSFEVRRVYGGNWADFPAPVHSPLVLEIVLPKRAQNIPALISADMPTGERGGRFEMA